MLGSSTPDMQIVTLPCTCELTIDWDGTDFPSIDGVKNCCSVHTQAAADAAKKRQDADDERLAAALTRRGYTIVPPPAQQLTSQRIL